jgi:hypothetical protein
VPAERSGPGFTEVGAQRTGPAPGPDSPPQNEWSDWYRSTEPRLPFEPPPNQPLANQPLSRQPSMDQTPASPPPPYQPPGYQPSGYQPPGYQPRPYQPPVYPHAAMPTPVDEQPFGLRFESPPAKAPPWRQYGTADGERRSRAPLFWSVLSSAVAIAVVVCVLLLHPFSHNEAASDAANSAGTTPTASAAAANSRAATVSSSPSASSARSGLTAAVTERQAASTVAGMLASSVADRTAIDNSYTDVDGCGPNLGNDAAVFTRAANSRRAMAARLATMPGRSTLPLALLSDLASAWQESSAADQGLATWAKDEVAKGCVRNDTNDPGYRTTLTRTTRRPRTRPPSSPSGTRSPPATASPATSRASSSRVQPPGPGVRRPPRRQPPMSQRIAAQTSEEISLMVSMPYCSVGLPVVSTEMR